MEVIQKISGLVLPFLEEQGIELVDIGCRRESGNFMLRILVDKTGGITLGECVALNNALGDMLDASDAITGSYILEVSSPGLDRHLKTDNDFKRVLGRVLEVSTYDTVDAKRSHQGVLIGMNNESIVLEHEGMSTVISKSLIAKAVQMVQFDIHEDKGSGA